MIVVRSVDEVKYDPDSVVTVGTFDGVHRGHAAIILEVVRRARRINARSVVMTFDPHPRDVVGRGPVKQLATVDERLAIIQSLGIDITVVLPFTYEFSRLSPEGFYQRYVVKGLGVREVIEGYDHFFGRDREAGIETLRDLGNALGFNVVITDPVTVNGEIVSSSRIRDLLVRGDVEQAEQYLGRPYALEGTVIKGDGRGTHLGFPTANILPSSEKKLVPADGVYVVGVDLDAQHYHGMSNIGVRPTFSPARDRMIEVHIFDIDERLYDKHLRVQFLKRLREEKKFSSKEELVSQLHRDRNESMKYLGTLQQIQNSI